MHDFHGNELEVGDEVIIRYIIKSIQATEDYCNCQLESVNPRKPDGQKESYCGNLNVSEKVFSVTAAGLAAAEEILARPKANY